MYWLYDWGRTSISQDANYLGLIFSPLCHFEKDNLGLSPPSVTLRKTTWGYHPPLSFWKRQLEGITPLSHFEKDNLGLSFPSVILKKTTWGYQPPLSLWGRQLEVITPLCHFEKDNLGLSPPSVTLRKTTCGYHPPLSHTYDAPHNDQLFICMVGLTSLFNSVITFKDKTLNMLYDILVAHCKFLYDKWFFILNIPVIVLFMTICFSV